MILSKNKTILNSIHQSDINIVVEDREIKELEEEVKIILEKEIELRFSGDSTIILDSLKKELIKQKSNLLTKDIENLLLRFAEITGAKSFRLLLTTVKTNMCSRFHTDGNDLRLLCTYYGPGTIWLSEDNVNRGALNSSLDNDAICLDKTKVQQAKTGSILILKGAIYPQLGTKAVVHRSPTIEEACEKRLLLRIDTNDFLVFE